MDNSIQYNDGALSILEGLRCPEHWTTEHGNKCVLNWRLETTILNIPGQKYTLGKDFKSFKAEEGAQFVSLPNRTEIGKVQCQICCDIQGNFWLHPLGHSETFANGVLLTVPIKLKFGDIFYFSHKLSQFWNPHLNPSSAPGLTIIDKNGVQPLVFKFERLISKNKCKHSAHKHPKMTSSPTTKEDDPSAPFLKSGAPPNSSWCDNDIILSKIFDHLLDGSNYTDLFNCRRVSKSWNRSASSILKSHFVPRFTIIMDNLIESPNKIASDFHWHSHRMRLKFDEWKIDMWPAGGGEAIRDTEERDKVVAKFYLDFSNFLHHNKSSPIKRLDLNIDYLLPINLLVSKFAHTLELFKIQVNMLWIRDEALISFPTNLQLPRLTTVNLWFSAITSGDLDLIKNSVWLKAFLETVSTSCETMVLKNYAKLPVDFSKFTKLKTVTVTGECGYGIWDLRLQTGLDQLSLIPCGQLTSFKLVMKDIDLFEEKALVEEALLRFLDRQRNSLESLELIVPQGTLTAKIPKSFPRLKKLWISTDIYWEGRDSIWGIKLTGQVAKLGIGFQTDFDITMLPLVSFGKWRNGQGHDLSLAFGKWDLIAREFVSFIPNAEKMWAWDC